KPTSKSFLTSAELNKAVGGRWWSGSSSGAYLFAKVICRAGQPFAGQSRSATEKLHTASSFAAFFSWQAAQSGLVRALIGETHLFEFLFQPHMLFGWHCSSPRTLEFGLSGSSFALRSKSEAMDFIMICSVK